MAGLLVSVRSAEEARAACAGGAAVIDVKEPDRGPLGRADVSIWRAVRDVVPDSVPVSVALGELCEWLVPDGPPPPGLGGIAFRKLGLSGAGPRWAEEWASLRTSLGPGPAWVAVIYADATAARAPRPEEVLEVALSVEECRGVLIDTWDKSRPSTVDDSWAPWFGRIRHAGRFLALAGGLDAAAIARLAPLGPDLFAVRGAACSGGNRQGRVDRDRVAELVRAAESAAG